MQWPKIDRLLRLLVIGLAAGLGAFGTAVHRGLYGDGSFFFLLTLEPGHPSLFHPSRWFSQLITQFPELLAKRLGATDLTLLLNLHSFGLVMIPVLIWIVALSLHFKSRLFWPLAFGFATTFLLTGFFAVGEYNVTFALVGLSFALIQLVNHNWLSDLALLVSSILLVRSFESMLFLGPLLFVVAQHKAWTLRAADRSQSKYRIVLIASSLFFAMSAGVAYLGILNPFNPSNMVSALDLIKPSVFSPTSALVLLAILLATLGTLWQKPTVTVSVTTIVMIASGIYLYQPQFWLAPEQNYFWRVYSGVLFFGVISLGFLIQFVKKYRPLAQISISLTTLGVVVALIVPQFIHTEQWSRWLLKYEEVVQSSNSWVPIDQSQMREDQSLYEEFNWFWTNPSMSLILRNGGNGGLLNSPNVTYNPYSPLSNEQDPTRRYQH